MGFLNLFSFPFSCSRSITSINSVLCLLTLGFDHQYNVKKKDNGRLTEDKL